MTDFDEMVKRNQGRDHGKPIVTEHPASAATTPSERVKEIPEPEVKLPRAIKVRTIKRFVVLVTSAVFAILGTLQLNTTLTLYNYAYSTGALGAGVPGVAQTISTGYMLTALFFGLSIGSLVLGIMLFRRRTC